MALYAIAAMFPTVIKFSRNGVPPPVSGVPPPKLVVPPPGNDVPSPFWENH